MKDITISRRSLLVSAGLLALAPLAGCGGNSGSGSAAAGSDYTIGVLQLTEHSALDAANDVFVKAIKESGLKVKIDQKNAQNDQSTCKSIADKFVGDNVNLIYAIATPAAQAAAGATADIPIVGCATLYDWDAHDCEGYQWWISRVKNQLQILDILRIDHFRGFEAYWAVPYGCFAGWSGKAGVPRL